MKKVLCLILCLLLMMPVISVHATEDTQTTEDEGTVADPIEGAGEFVVSLSGVQAGENTVKLSTDVEVALANKMSSDPAEIMAASSLTVNQELYTLLSAEGAKKLHMELSYSPAHDQFDWYIDAKNNHESYTQYKNYEIKGVALQAKIVELAGDDRVALDMAAIDPNVEQQYTMAVPVPKLMKDCEAYAVALFSDSAVSQLIPVTPQGGVLTWTMATMQPIAVLGFGSQTDIIVSQNPVTVSGTRVKLPVDIDGAVKTTFGDQIADRLVFWMNKADYDQLVDPSVATLHFALTSASQTVSADKMIAAKNADVRYKTYADNQVKGIALNMELMYASDRMYASLGNVYERIKNYNFDLQIPVPPSLKSCEVLTVAAVNEKGITMLMPVSQENGMVILPSAVRFGTFVMIGFGAAKTTSATATSWGDFFHALFFEGAFKDVPWLLWVIMIGGVLLIAGGIVLLIMVTFRKRKKRIKEAIKERDEGSHVLLNPTSKEEMDWESAASEEAAVPAQPVIMDMDEQTDLTTEEREQYRVKSNHDEAAFDGIASESVSPAAQIGDDQLETIRREAAAPQKRVSVDDLLEEVTGDLERLDKKQ